MDESGRADQRVLEDLLVVAGDVAPWMAERLVPQIIDALRALPVEQRIEAMGLDGLKHQADVMMAIHDVSYHYRPVQVAVRGTHVNYTSITAGDHEFVDSDGERRLIEWAKALRARKANAPLPEPEPAP